MLKSEKGFTLIEMLIVITIISLLIILIIPNVGTKSKTVNDKGCEALKQVVQSQVHAYYLDKDKYPGNVVDLKKAGYISEEQEACKNKKTFSISNGKVSIEE